jgi:hypothetical protein
LAGLNDLCVVERRVGVVDWEKGIVGRPEIEEECDEKRKQKNKVEEFLGGDVSSSVTPVGTR